LEAFFPSLTFRAGIHCAPKGKGFGAFLQIRVSYGGPLIFSLSFLCFNYIRLKGICQEFFYFFGAIRASDKQPALSSSVYPTPLRRSLSLDELSISNMASKVNRKCCTKLGSFWREFLCILSIDKSALAR